MRNMRFRVRTIRGDGHCLFRAIATAWFHSVFGLHLGYGGGKFVRDVVSYVVVGWLRYVSAHRIWTGDKVVAEQIQGKTLVGVLFACARLLKRFGNEPMTAEWAGQIRNYVSIRAPNVLRGAPNPKARLGVDRDLTAEIVVKSSSDLPFDRYAKAMLGRMWGGDLEVMVLSEILSMPIVIRSSSGAVLSRHGRKTEGRALQIVYVGSCHYDAALPVEHMAPMIQLRA